MKYPDGREVRLGDVVALGSDQQGIVVCSIDTGEYSDAYPRAQWGYLDAGVLIEFPSYGLIHYKEPEAGLRLVAHASGLEIDSNRSEQRHTARLKSFSPAISEDRRHALNFEMMAGKEVDDLAEIGGFNDRLARTLLPLSVGNEMRVINGIAVRQPIRVFLFEGGLWWAHREYARPRSLVPTQYNNLFGLDGHGTQSNIEVNFPLGKFRRSLQGAFVRSPNGSVMLCHRGGVQHGRRRFSVLDAMRDMGAALVRVADDGSPLIRICFVDRLQIQEIVGFVSNIIQAKNT